MRKKEEEMEEEKEVEEEMMEEEEEREMEEEGMEEEEMEEEVGETLRVKCRGMTGKRIHLSKDEDAETGDRVVGK